LQAGFLGKLLTFLQILGIMAPGEQAMHCRDCVLAVISRGVSEVGNNATRGTAPMKRRLWSAIGVLMLGGLLAAAVTGCPSAPPDATLALMVSPASLDFGTDETSLTVQVCKNYTSVPLGRFLASSNVSWATVSPETGTSSGPDDPATISISVNRDLMSIGTNLATVSITAEGASRVQVSVQAVREVTAAFAVSSNSAFVDELLQFKDESRTVSGTPSIISWQWDFGDGASSTEQNPPHAYASTGSYDVSLTVSTGDKTATLTRRDYVFIRAKEPPIADFSAEPLNTIPGETIYFTSLAEPGTSPITSYSWDFGDGRTSRLQNPSYAYAEVGTYAVTLTVQSAHGQDTKTKQNYITVSPVAPQAAFSADVREVVLVSSGAKVQFQDLSQAGTFPIVEWFWEFGDGATSTVTSPLHTYQKTGSFTVSLTVTAQNGQTNTATIANYVRVIENTIVAEFTADTQNAYTEQEIQFTDASYAIPPPITSWLWDFGDGGASSMANPRHAYSEEGVYTVTLRVANAYGSDTEVKTNYITVSALSTLERYIIESGPPSYSVYSSVAVPYEDQTITLTVLDLRSQTFRSGEVAPAQWRHWMLVATPSVAASNTALMIIAGGSNSDTPNFDPANLPTEALIALDFVAQMGAVAVVLPTVPNQPLVFHNDGVGRYEDEAIAYTYDQYLNGGDEFWPLLLPMTKSAVSAMDVTQQFGATLGLAVNDFVVTGASKRGWTTWLTAVADDRVRAIAPLVIDVLNMKTQMDYHYQAYNGYSAAVHDYVDFNIFGRFGTVEGQQLLGIVDPYSYLSLLTMPKLIINSTGDQFFLPDSAQFYVHDLPGETRLRYMPNTDHSLEQGTAYEELAASIFSFFEEVTTDAPLPSFTWEVTADNEIRVQTDSAFPPAEVRLWSATVNGPARDFRYETVGPIWSSAPLSDPDDDGVYIAAVTTPAAPSTWTGFFVELTFNHGGILHAFCTELRVTPNTMPYEPPVSEAYKYAGGSVSP